MNDDQAKSEKLNFISCTMIDLQFSSLVFFFTQQKQASRDRLVILETPTTENENAP
jgi:hypothetical protein